jgi:hypothetical protein
MLFDRSVLERYSEFLDQQGLVIGDGPAQVQATRKQPGEDKRSHEQLVEDFLGSEREPWDEGVLPPGWVLPDQQVAQAEMHLGALRADLRREEGRRVSAERLMTDRAHYIPREEYDRIERLYQTLDKAYADSQALHLHRDNVEAGLNGDVTRLKTKLVQDTERLRAKLKKAYGILAGAYPALNDADLARVLYDQSPPPEDWDEGTWDQLTDAQKSVWRAYAERLRVEWSTVETPPMPYAVMAQEWAAAKQELLKIDECIQQYAPGLERRIGPDEWMETGDAVRALFSFVRDVVVAIQPLAQSWWHVLRAAANTMGYEVQPPTGRKVDHWEAPESTQTSEPDLSGVLAERIQQTKQRASEAGAEALWTAQPEGFPDNTDAAVAGYMLPPEDSVTHSHGQHGPHTHTAEEYRSHQQPIEEETVNATQTPEDAARELAQEIGRLGEGLAAEGITLRPGPVHGAEVDTALAHIRGTFEDTGAFSPSGGGQVVAEKLSRAQHALSRLRVGLEREGIANAPDEDSVDTALRVIQGWGNAHLGLATTKTLLEELYARAGRNRWQGVYMERVRSLLDELPEDELTYKTVDGRAASAG